jgi:hypothetical protein
VLFFLMHVALRRLLRVFGGGFLVAALEVELPRGGVDLSSYAAV